MRRLGVTLLLSALLPLIAPVQADAFWRWLDELSGPGKFHGIDLDIRIVCTSKPMLAKDYQSKLMEFAETARVLAEKKALDAALVAAENAREGKDSEVAQDAKVLLMNAGVATGCIFQEKEFNRRRTRSFNVALGYQLSERTNLTYAVEPEKERTVFNVSVRPMYWWRVMRAVELGAGGGVYWFKGTGANAGVFRKHSLEVAADIKPVALFRDWATDDPYKGIPDAQYDQLLSVRVGLLTFLEGFKASEFGAVEFRDHVTEVGREVMWTLSVCIDLEPAFRMKRASRKLEELMTAKK